MLGNFQFSCNKFIMFNKVSLTVVLCLVVAHYSNAVAEAQAAYSYRAAFTVAGAVGGDVTSRQADVASSIETMLNEIAGLSFDLSSATLEKLTSGATSELIVLLNFGNITHNADDFTSLLSSSSFTTTINASTVTGADYNECPSNYGNCSSYADCSNTNGSFTCTCKNTYIDRSASGSGFVCEIPFTVSCTTDSATLEWDTQYSNNLGVPVNDVKFGTCSGTLNGTVLQFSGLCGPSFNNNSTHIEMSWNVTNNNESALITTGNYFTYKVSCPFENTGNVTVDFQVEENVINTDGINDILNSLSPQALAFSFQLFTSDSFSVETEVSSGSQIPTTSLLNLQFDSPLNNPNVVISCTDLSVSPKDSSTSIPVVERGCLAQSTPSNNAIVSQSRVLSNGVSRRARITTPPVRFAASLETRMTARLVLCVLSGGAGCGHTCSRRRRSVVTMRIKRSNEFASGEASFVYKLPANDPKCTEECEEGACVLDAIGNVFCLCPENSMLGTNGTCQTTSNTGLGRPDGETAGFDQTILYILIGLAVVFVLLIFILFIVIFNRRFASKSLL